MTTFGKAVSVDMEAELTQVLAKTVQEEIDNNIMSDMLVSMGWTKITVRNRHKIAADWCTKNIRSPYRIFGDHWCFQDTRDAAWFGLKWS